MALVSKADNGRVDYMLTRRTSVWRLFIEGRLVPKRQNRQV